ncbi:MAG: hypothetical protein JSV96_00595, partial [Candidatus Aminicenantes bacterium]
IPKPKPKKKANAKAGSKKKATVKNGKVKIASIGELSNAMKIKSRPTSENRKWAVEGKEMKELKKEANQLLKIKDSK